MFSRCCDKKNKLRGPQTKQQLSSFPLIFVANKPPDPLTRAELRQSPCCMNPRYSPRHQLVHHLCLFDPLADSPSSLKCIFRILSNVEAMLPTVTLVEGVISLSRFALNVCRYKLQGREKDLTGEVVCGTFLVTS